MEVWFDEFELKAVPREERLNISSPEALRITLRNFRDERRNTETMPIEKILNFYSKLIDNLYFSIRIIAFESDRFMGWTNWLAFSPLFESVS